MNGRIACVFVFMLCACGQTSAPVAEDSATPMATPNPAIAMPAPAPTTAATAHLTLAPLEENDGQVITEAMQNVGGCQFADGDKRTLLSLGLPDSTTDRAVAVARPGGRQAKLLTDEGGRSRIEAGPTMRFEGIAIEVSHPAGPGEATGIETHAWPATLAVSDAEGAIRSYTGTWSCGV